ncbi:hypothetical protein AVEN_95038-1 [Araneus ventricosus]|uniref:Uncharacterized protein n=1 Tax=Araneus ventricosus TaxID=182803 RepID=A0A4Y2MTU5_ARAVE|nr:hypothetical protein AVEN_95038-1 [Araneus ventricosus]
MFWEYGRWSPISCVVLISRFSSQIFYPQLETKRIYSKHTSQTYLSTKPLFGLQRVKLYHLLQIWLHLQEM